jgi:hypothetical protein
MKIVTFNGGGAKGQRTATYLSEQERQGFKIHEADFFAGTSYGSIQAGLLSIGFTPSQIEKKCIDLGPKVFQKEPFRFGIFREKYDNENLINLCKETFQGVEFGELKKHLVIPIVNITYGKVDFISTVSEKNKKMKVEDVVIASCSAPSFFKPYSFGGSHYIDGGMAMNNMCFSAWIEANKISKEAHTVTSLTTGSETVEDYKAMLRWAIKDAPHLINILLNEQDQTSHHYAEQVIGNDNYQRIEMISDLSSGKIDDFSKENTILMIQEGMRTARFYKNKYKF